jgi:predicted dehydrogenase
MRRIIPAVALLVMSSGLRLKGEERVTQARLMVLDPGHFHAGLIQKDMYPWLSKQVAVYAPLGPDVIDYLNRISQFNNRKENPTSWEVEIHTGPDFLERMLREHPGNAVIISGRNRPKIDHARASVAAGLHVLLDKPWIIHSGDMSKLEQVLNDAERQGTVAYDIMTERYEITSMLQRALVNDAAVFGAMEKGSDAQPAVTARSVHQLMKLVAGVPLRRPVWFFDIDEYGEGLADVGTHVVDLVQWTAFPEQKLDYRTDIRVLDGKRWPTVMSKTDFQKVTGVPEFPQFLAKHVKDGKLEYFCNNSVHYTVRDMHVKLEIVWNWEAVDDSGDVYEASFRGTKARVEIRQGKPEHYHPELYVTPNSPGVQAEVFAALKQKIAALQSDYPGVAIEERAGEAHIAIPARYSVGHEAHFAQVTNKFFEYVKSPQTIPAWEKPNMLVKYFITTKGVEVSQ